MKRIWAILLLGAMVLGLCGCLEPVEPVSQETFRQVMEDRGYTVAVDSEVQGDLCLTALTAEKENGPAVRYLQMVDPEAAEMVYSAGIDSGKSKYDGQTFATNSGHYLNAEHFSMTVSDFHLYAYLVEDTVILATGSKDSKQEIRQIRRDLGCK